MDDNWKEGLTEENLLNALTEMFYNDLEKWFDAGTFYCESCVDDFIKKWPGIYSRDLQFQKNTIDLDSFYDGGRIQDLFTKEEFDNLIKEMTCPNCGNKISSYIFPYDMRFDVPNNFEFDIDEIAKFADSTPFLMLSHPFAKQVYDEINALSGLTNNSLSENTLYRARRYEENHEYTANDFLAADKSLIKEGRYNHAGKQVLYLGEDENTCFLETRSPTLGIMLAEVEIHKNLKILDLMSDDLEGNNIIQAISASSLMSSPSEGEGWYKPHYVFTRFVADVAMAAGFDAIRYPSVRTNTGNNIVILNYEDIIEHVKIISFKHIPKINIRTNNRL